MKEKDSNKIENTELAPIRKEEPVEETKLRHMTDEEIIQGFRYLMNKDRKKDRWMTSE